MLDKLEKAEFEELVEEIKPLGFNHSNQVSNYIMKNKLGLKYRNISGVVKMKNDENTWDFHGGFPPKIYARLCQRLNLRNQGTRAQVLEFKAFKDLGL